jgi:hypothetical protein
VPKPVRDDLSSGWELDSPASMPLRRPKGRSKPPPAGSPSNESPQKEKKRSKRSTRNSAPSSNLSVSGSAPVPAPETTADTESKPVESKPVESKPEVIEAKPEAVESKPETESKPEAVEAKPEEVPHPRAQTEPLATTSDTESGSPSSDADPLPPPPRKRRPTMPAILQKTRALALPAPSPLVPRPAGGKSRFPTQPFKALEREPGAPLVPLGSPEDSHPTAVDTESPLMHPPPIPADARPPTADELHPPLDEEVSAADTNLKLPVEPSPRLRITRPRMPPSPVGRDERDEIDEVTVTEEDEPPEPPTQVTRPDRPYLPLVVAAPPVAVAAPPVVAPAPPFAAVAAGSSRRNLVAAVLVTAVIAGGLGYLLGSAGDEETTEPPEQAVAVPPECPEPPPSAVTPPPPDPALAVTPPEVDAGVEQPSRPTSDAPRPCYLNAVSTPSGANVFIDSSLAGRSPLRKQVSCGKHSVRFELASYGTVDRSVSIRRGSTAKVAAQMSRPPTSLRVESSPSGATVRVNGATVGVTPLSTSVTSGVPATVTLSKAGFKSVTQKVTPNPGGGRVGVTLKRDGR